VKTISDRLAGHDLAVVIGAEVFRYYPYVPGDFLPAGTELLQITASPEAALNADTTTVIVVSTQPQRAML
jgi:benzoylformate decarboxylase